MTKEELAELFLEVDLSSLDYISVIIIHFTKVQRDSKNPHEVQEDIFKTLNEVTNLQLAYEDSND